MARLDARRPALRQGLDLAGLQGGGRIELALATARGPASIEVCTLFNKPARRLTNIPLKYKGFDLPDRFIVGYGLDYREAYRHLPYVAELRPEILNLA